MFDKFIAAVEATIADCPDFFKEDEYEEFQALKSMLEEKASSEVSEGGARILTWMQANKDLYNNIMSAKTIGEGLFISSRSVSGAMRKLVSCGYVEKIGVNPVQYSLTEKGSTYLTN